MSQEGAIQSDVQQQQTEVDDVVAKQKTARELMLEEIESRHTAELAAQNGYSLEDQPDPEPVPAPAPAAAAPEPDQLAAQLAAAEPPAAAPNMVKIKVDGIEQEVPLDDVVRQYQKNSSADKRLAEATRLLREAQETAAQRLLEAQQAQQVQQQVAPAPQPDPASAPNAETGKEFLKALFEGDEDNALAKLQELTMQGRQAPVQPAQPTLDIDQISSAVAQHVQQKLAVESALAKNRADYPQLYADPDIEALALAKIQRIRESDGSDFFSALDTVSQEFANKFGWNQPAATGRQTDPAPPTTSKREAKLERKAGIDNVVSINTKTSSSEPQPESPSDIIAQMRAARGG